MTIEAMQLALEALEHEANIGNDNAYQRERDALRTAIAEAEKQEPRCAVIVEVFGKDWRLDYMSLPVGKHKLYTQQYVYTTPPATQPAPVQVSPTDFVDMVMDKEDAIGKPIFWAEWPNRENNT